MPKVQNITEVDIAEADAIGSDLTHTLHAIANRMEQGHCNDLTDPLTLARSIACLAGAANRVTVQLLQKHAMQEQRKQLDELRAKARAEHTDD